MVLKKNIHNICTCIRSWSRRDMEPVYRTYKHKKCSCAVALWDLLEAVDGLVANIYLAE